MGITNEDISPEEHFCEECRRDLHRLFTSPNGYVQSITKSASPFWACTKNSGPRLYRGAVYA
jgi:hypothetical protein